MKLVGVITSAVLALVLGISAPVHGQEQRGDQQEAKPAQQEEHAQQEDKKAEKQKPAKQEEKNAQQQEKNNQEEKNTQQQNRNGQEEKNVQQAKAGQQADHGRIPQDRFQANFGREHVFVINQPVIVEGQPRFQYGGYWFGFGEPWPMGWSYSDNVYVDYIDGGYYLYNPVHPGIRVVINVF